MIALDNGLLYSVEEEEDVEEEVELEEEEDEKAKTVDLSPEEYSKRQQWERYSIAYLVHHQSSIILTSTPKGARVPETKTRGGRWGRDTIIGRRH